MPDISMCRDHDCPSRAKCYRYRAAPAPFWQAFGTFPRDDGWQRCLWFMPLPRNPDRPLLDISEIENEIAVET